MDNLIIIPTYNECDNIAGIIEEIYKYIDIDILVIDDNSQDGTADIVKNLKKNNQRIHLIERPGKLGLASAYICGFKFAIKNSFKNVFEMDADFSHNPKYLPDFLENIKNNDMVIGSRYVKGGGVSNWSKFRRAISRYGNLYAKIILNCPVKDLTGGFICYDVDKLKNFDLDKISSEGYSFQIEMKYIFYKYGFNIKEIPIVFEERREGKSKMSKAVFIEAMFKVIKFKFMNVKKFIKEN